MKSIDWSLVFVFVLFMAVGFGIGVQFERIHNPVVQVAAPIDQAVIVDLKEIDKRERQMAKRINEQEAKIKELYSRTEYLKGILEQVINFINGATTASPAPQGNAL
jgi:hypothetical protein